MATVYMFSLLLTVRLKYLDIVDGTLENHQQTVLNCDQIDWQSWLTDKALGIENVIPYLTSEGCVGGVLDSSDESENSVVTMGDRGTRFENKAMPTSRENICSLKEELNIAERGGKELQKQNAEEEQLEKYEDNMEDSDTQLRDVDMEELDKLEVTSKKIYEHED
jgi:hypothetical protein